MKWQDFDVNKNAFPETIKIIIEWLWFISKRWNNISDKNKFIEQNLQPLITGSFRNPKIKNGVIQEPTPALGTFLRNLGFIDDDYNLSDLLKLLALKKITIQEYLFINLSKQRGWINDVPKVNFLALLSLYIRQHGYCDVTTRMLENLSKVKSYNFDEDDGIEINRNDILYNNIKFTGLFDEYAEKANERKLVLHEDAKDIINFIADNFKEITVSNCTSKNERYKYYGDLENGIFKLAGKKLPNSWYKYFPNLLSSVMGANITPQELNMKYCQYITAIKTKPFLLLAGISGTGKSRIVRELARACWQPGSDEFKAQKPSNFEMVQVKPNWHDSSELIGYVSRIDGERFIAGDFLKFIAKAWENEGVPYFLCLDEMNLAPVEQYFAEYLSVIESRKSNGNKVITDPILNPVFEKAGNEKNIKTWYKNLIKELLADCSDEKVFALTKQFETEGITIPQNLIVIGTVNMDETTFSFSRKVLDRAMTIEMNEVLLDSGLTSKYEAIGKLGEAELIGTNVEGVDVYADNKDVCDKVIAYLQKVNDKLEGKPFKVAYRTRNEFLLYVVNNLPYNKDNDGNEIPQELVIARALDEITSMKVLSRIEGDEAKVPEAWLKELQETIKKLLNEQVENVVFTADIITDENKTDENGNTCVQSVSLAKLNEMIDRLGSGYTSFWS